MTGGHSLSGVTEAGVCMKPSCPATLSSRAQPGPGDTGNPGAWVGASGPGRGLAEQQPLCLTWRGLVDLHYYQGPKHGQLLWALQTFSAIIRCKMFETAAAIPFQAPLHTPLPTPLQVHYKTVQSCIAL